MATRPQVRPEDYLATVYEAPDPELVHGELIRRSMPDLVHSWVQAQLITIVSSLTGGDRMLPVPELRLRLAHDLVRVPDVSVFRGALPAELVPMQAPYGVIEIVSRDDRYSELLQKLDEYHRWGVAHVWVVDPWLEKLSVYDGALRAVDRLQFPGTARGITIAELVADLKSYPGHR